MSDMEKKIMETREFVEGTQEIVAKLNDIVATINDLLIKQNVKSGNVGEMQTAGDPAFEQELSQLFQRYFIQDHSSSAPVMTSQRPSLESDKVSTPRPGKYRQRV